MEEWLLITADRATDTALRILTAAGARPRGQFGPQVSTVSIPAGAGPRLAAAIAASGQLVPARDGASHRVSDQTGNLALRAAAIRATPRPRPARFHYEVGEGFFEDADAEEATLRPQRHATRRRRRHRRPVRKRSALRSRRSPARAACPSASSTRSASASSWSTGPPRVDDRLRGACRISSTRSSRGSRASHGMEPEAKISTVLDIFYPTVDVEPWKNARWLWRKSNGAGLPVYKAALREALGGLRRRRPWLRAGAS